MSDRTSEPRPSGYSGYVPSGGYDESAFDYDIAATYGSGMEMRNGRIVEPYDDQNDQYLDGLAELRAMKRREREDASRTSHNRR